MNNLGQWSETRKTVAENSELQEHKMRNRVKSSENNKQILYYETSRRLNLRL